MFRKGVAKLGSTSLRWHETRHLTFDDFGVIRRALTRRIGYQTPAQIHRGSNGG